MGSSQLDLTLDDVLLREISHDFKTARSHDFPGISSGDSPQESMDQRPEKEHPAVSPNPQVNPQRNLHHDDIWREKKKGPELKNDVITWLGVMPS